MKNLLAFCKDNNYNLLDEFIYNSYRTGTRSETRDYDSISVTELLGLIGDPNMDMIKNLHGDKLQQACDYGTSIHNILEEYHYTGKLPDIPIAIQFMKSLIENDIIIDKAEEVYSLDLDIGIPLTATIDVIASIDSDSILIDYKTSSKNRNFISIKYKLQIAMYSLLSGIDRGAILYLNQKGYKFIEIEELDKYKQISKELIEYAESLYNKGSAINLYIK